MQGVERYRELLGSHWRVANQLEHRTVVYARLNLRDEARVDALAAMDIQRRTLSTTFDVASAYERRRLLAVRRPSINHYVSLMNRPGDERDAWDAVLFWKGIARRHGREVIERSVASGDPELAELLATLGSLRRQVSELYSSPRPPDSEDLAKAVDAKERAERALALRSARYAEEQDAAVVDADRVLATLDDDTALVDFLSFFRFEWDEEGQMSRRMTYAAFVARRDGVHRVDLPDADGLDR